MAAAEGYGNYGYDEIATPLWLNKQFLTQVLKWHHNNYDLQVVQMTFSPAANKGDHFASIMFRVKVQYQLQAMPLTISLIVKTMPESEGLKKDMIGESDLCYKEVMMYSNIIPKFEKILKDVGDETVFAPKCIYRILAPKQVIIMEDLCTLGFELIRGRFAALDEANACYEKIAKWHALSYKLSIEEPELIHEFRYKWLVEVMEHSVMTEGLALFIELLGSVPTLSKYKPFFETLRSQKLSKVRESLELYNQEPRPAGWYVLNHGDFHSRNVMFQSATGRTPHCRLLDFQVCYMGAPVLDILYSLYMLVDARVRLQKRDELLSYYHKTFVETLKKTDFKGIVPNFDDLKKQMLQHKHYELFLLHSFRPIVLGIVGGKFDIIEMFQNYEIRREAYNNQAYIDELHLTLPKFEELGLFNT